MCDVMDVGADVLWCAVLCCGQLEKFLKLEMRKWLTLLGDLDLLPTFFGQDFRYIFLQPVTGTVTIVPAATLRDYLYACALL
jgi:hypothetical protein